MRERFSGRGTKATHHAPRRLLLLDTQNGPARLVRFKIQMQFGRFRHSSTHEEARIQGGMPRRCDIEERREGVCERGFAHSFHSGEKGRFEFQRI